MLNFDAVVYQPNAAMFVLFAVNVVGVEGSYRNLDIIAI